MFRTWQRSLGDVAVLRVRLSGRESRWQEPPYASFRDLLDDVMSGVMKLDGDIALFGHSMGAIVAFEVAHELSARGRRPVHLVASGCVAPSLLERARASKDANADLGRYLGPRTGELTNTLSSRTADEVAALAGEQLRSDVRVLRTYVSELGRTLACNITVLRGTDDSSVPAHAVEAWAQETSGRCWTMTVDGDHFFIDTLGDEVVGHVASALADASSW